MVFEKELAKSFRLYVDYIHSLNRKSKEDGYRYLIDNYVNQFNEFFKIYNKGNDFREVYVYRDKDYKKCRIILGAETNKNLIKFSVKQLNDVKEEIFFLKNYIVIQKELNIANFSIIEGIIDHNEITHAILISELTK